MRKRILLITIIIIFTFIASCLAKDISREEAEGRLTICAGRTMWFDKHSALEWSISYREEAQPFKRMSPEVYKELKEESELFYSLYSKLQNLEKSTIGIIDFDNKIIVVNNQDSSSVNIPCRTYSNMLRLFTSLTFLTSDPFDSEESEQEIYDIKHGKMHIGFNREQATLCWGRPEKNNKTTTSNGTREQWIYNIGVDATYLYLDNGNVTGWQN